MESSKKGDFILNLRHIFLLKYDILTLKNKKNKFLQKKVLTYNFRFGILLVRERKLGA